MVDQQEVNILSYFHIQKFVQEWVLSSLSPSDPHFQELFFKYDHLNAHLFHLYFLK